jgi:hypothetical protein
VRDTDKNLYMSVGVMKLLGLKTKTKRFTRLSYTGLVVELEYLKIETRLRDEKFASVMGEYVFLK